MALELLGGPFPLVPVVDRDAVVGRAPTAYADFTGDAMFVEGRGVLSQGSNRRHLVQHDGSFATLGQGRYRQQSQVVLAWVDGGKRGYAEFERYSDAASRLYALHPVTLMGWRAIGARPPGNLQSVGALLPNGRWLRPLTSGVGEWNGIEWVRVADLSELFFTGALEYLSWADGPEEIWLGTRTGECVRYNWATRTRTSGRLRLDAGSSMGLWYWQKHDLLVSMNMELLPGAMSYRALVRVHATSPRPAKLVQTVAPAPMAGRVSRVTTRVLGSYDEPCAGENIRWSASSALSLVPLQSVTDADGYAYADLIVPMGASGSGDVTSEAVV